MTQKQAMRICWNYCWTSVSVNLHTHAQKLQSTIFLMQWTYHRVVQKTKNRIIKSAS